VLQLVHENTAAAVLFGIDKVNKDAQNHNVLFYNMGGIDTEVTIAKYSHINTTDKNKLTPYIEIISESADRNLGSLDFDIVLVNLLADKFNSLPERQGKPDCRENVRAVKRLQKEAIRIKEVFSANKEASVKISELIDGVTLKITLDRDEFEARSSHIFSKVWAPVEDALEKAGMTLEQLDQIELLGGGVRTPKVLEIIESRVGGKKELGTHLNGDEAMCFGSAFIGSNLTTSFKVASVLLT